MDKKKENYQKLKAFSKNLGISLFGVADTAEVRSEFCMDQATKSRFDRAISCGQRLIDSVLDDIKDKPTPLYFHLYRQVNFFLDRAALLISSFIQETGYHALPIPASQIVDWENQRAHLSHKKIGYLAGLGWIGRNNLLVNPELGARFRLVTVLTDMPLSTAVPLEDGCNECRKCLSVCPAQAIRERKEDFDHQACFAKLTEFKRAGLVSQHICGICVKVCRGTARN
jgi:epoxyqueuosine reductase QueG